MLRQRASFSYGLSALVVLLSSPVLALDAVGGRTIAGGAIGGLNAGTFSGTIVLLRTNGAIKGGCLTAELITGTASFSFAKYSPDNIVAEGFSVSSSRPSGASCAKDFDYVTYTCGGCQFRWRVDALK